MLLFPLNYPIFSFFKFVKTNLLLHFVRNGILRVNGEAQYKVVRVILFSRVPGFLENLAPKLVIADVVNYTVVVSRFTFLFIGESI